MGAMRTLLLVFAAGMLPVLFGRLAGRVLRPHYLQWRWLWFSAFGDENDRRRAEKHYGDFLADAFRPRPGWNVPPASIARVNEIGRSLDSARNFRFHVVANQEPNAFALPGGNVFVTQSLLALCQHEPDEIAFILAHEMGHVLRGHHTERWFFEHVFTRLLPSAVAGLFSSRSHSQGQEFEADEEAIGVCSRAGFDTRGAVALLQRLERLEKQSKLASYLSTHPNAADRINHLQDRM